MDAFKPTFERLFYSTRNESFAIMKFFQKMIGSQQEVNPIHAL